MKISLSITVLLVLSACGIDGPPSQPEGGISVTGEAGIGVVGAL